MSAARILAGRDPDARLIAALFERLPPAGAVWPAGERQAWLSALALAFDLVYERAPGEAHVHAVARLTAPPERAA